MVVIVVVVIDSICFNDDWQLFLLVFHNNGIVDEIKFRMSWRKTLKLEENSGIGGLKENIEQFKS